MKKLLSILLVVAMLIPALALAEGTVYSHEADPYYRYTCPAGWTVLTKETVVSIVELGAQVSDNAMLSTYIDQVKTSDLVMFMSPNLSEFIVILAQPLGVDMSAEQLIPLLKPSFEQQFKSASPDTKTTNEGEVLRKGDNEFAKLAFSMPQGGIVLNMSIYPAILDKTMFMFMFMSLADDASVEAMFEETLASFTTAK